MKKEHKAKIKATRDAKRAQFSTQKIRIDDKWQIIRADELNWEVQKDGKFNGYAGSLTDAFRLLPSKMLSEDAGNSIALILDAQKGIINKIETALIGEKWK